MSEMQNDKLGVLFEESMQRLPQGLARRLNQIPKEQTVTDWGVVLPMLFLVPFVLGLLLVNLKGIGNLLVALSSLLVQALSAVPPMLFLLTPLPVIALMVVSLYLLFREDPAW